MGIEKSCRTKNILLSRVFDNFAGEVLRLIRNAWEQLQLPSGVNLETRITALFRNELLKCSDPQHITFIALEDPITDHGDGKELGRNDLRFYPQGHERQTIFFTVECKRLHTPDATLVSEYVKSGMMRFLIEENPKQYSRNLPCGAMLGYVLDGDTPRAFASVRAKIAEQKTTLRLSPENGFQTPSRHLRGYTFSADTRHTRENKSFSLHHILLPINTEKAFHPRLSKP
jgi:hypothetical protein